MASRAGIIGIFAAVGFVVGFFAFLASPVIGKALVEWIPTLMVDPSIVFAAMTGAVGAAISTITVTAWARRA
ncbi:hypothetical protein [Nitrososphaera sp.]|uniref:hypothetical protein n=1 Tax=Nitrososphaera sp. TaxID=1971748 RepID=UPI00307EF602